MERTFKCIIADDEAAARTAVRMLVDWKAYGMELCAEAEDGDRFMEIMEQEHPDLAVIDMRMPEISGDQLIHAINTKHQRTQVIVCSGFNDFEYLRAAILNNVVDYLLKPIDPEELNKAVGRAAERLQQEREQKGEIRTLHFPDRTVTICYKELAQEQEQIYNMIVYMEQEYMEKITLNTLSERFFWSKEYISKKFKEVTGCSVAEFLTYIRLERCKKLLKENEKLSVIIGETGFSDESHLVKMFKKYMGMSPSEYKKHERV